MASAKRSLLRGALDPRYEERAEMKTILISCCVMVLGLPAAADDAVAPKAAIANLLADQVVAWNRGDLEGFMAGYWKSPELTFSSGKDRTKGWQATIERYRKSYQAEGKEMGKLTFSEIETEVLSPEAAYVRGRWQLETSKGKPGGLFTLIVKKMPEGWRIVHDHTSN